MRHINNLVVHCTATTQNSKIESIQRYWRETLGWKQPGYHYIIKADGTIVNLQPVERPSNGVAGHNSDSIHVCYIGGIEKGKAVDNRTPAQKAALLSILGDLKARFPGARILGHRDFGAKKACPCFDAIKEYEHL